MMATDHYSRCAFCRTFLDDEDIFCSNCGAENPHHGMTNEGVVSQDEHHSFDCQGCGASMSYDASAQALRCPFCGSAAMQSVPSRRSLRCDWVVPLTVDLHQSESILRAWLGQGFWRPSDAARAAKIGEMVAVYIPFWVFEAETDTRWTADTSPAPPGSRGDWAPVYGENRSQYRDILVAGSSILTSHEISAILPFHLNRAIHYEKMDLENAIVETLKVARKAARPLARAAIEERERQNCARSAPGKPRRVKVNVRIHAMMGHPVLLPVWIMAYRYHDQVHRVLINGQTGKIAGSAPFSYGKLTLVVGGFVAVLVIILLLTLLMRMV